MKLVTVTEVKFNQSDKYKTRIMRIPSQNSKMYLNIYICFATPVSVEEQEVLALEYND